jgi:CheY-like chemotaxis protein
MYLAASEPEENTAFPFRSPDPSLSSVPATRLILIVEDDPDLRDTLADVLSYEGYPVVTAANGVEGLALLQSSPRPALILLDLMMPVMNGWQFRTAQLQDPVLASIPVAVVSAVDEAREHAEMLDAAAYLRKPIQIEKLLELVERYCP